MNEVLLRESLQNGDVDWEEGVVLAFYRMSRTPRRQSDSALPNPKWDALHRAFHSSLVAACGSRWLLGISETLFDLSDRYRHIVTATSAIHRDTDTEHRLIMEAVIRRDVAEATALLDQHVRDTADKAREYLTDQPDRPPPLETGAAARPQARRRGRPPKLNLAQPD